MAPTLEHVMTFRAVLDTPNMLMLGLTKGRATRGAAALGGGFLRGDGFDAKLLPGGSDWPLIDDVAGVVHLDGRAQFRDDSTGDMFVNPWAKGFYLSLLGVLPMDEAAQLALGNSPEAKSTKAGDHAWFATPVFEVSSEKHKWMERSWFVSQGHWHIPGDGSIAAEHDIYRLVAG